MHAFFKIIFICIFMGSIFPSSPLALASTSLEALKIKAENAYTRQKYDQAQALYGTLAERYKQEKGAHAVETFIARRELIKSVRGNGHYKQAQKLFSELIKEQEQILGKEHRQTLLSKISEAENFYYLGDVRKFLQQAKEVHALQERVMGPHHEDSLDSKSNIGSALFALGKNHEAQKVWQEALAQAEKHLGKEHRLTLHLQISLAVMQSVFGNVQKALAMYEVTQSIAEKNLHRQDSLLLNLYNNIATAHKKLGQNAKAEEFEAKVEEIESGIFKEDHPKELLARYKKAFSLTEKGQYAEAKIAAQDILARQQGILGELHEDTLHTQLLLLNCLISLYQIDQAHDILQEVIPRIKEKFGEDHKFTLYYLAKQATLYYSTGKLQESLHILTDIVLRFERTFGKSHYDTLGVRENLLHVQNDLGQNKNMAESLQSLVLHLERSLGKLHPQTLTARQNLALQLLKDGQPSKAFALLEFTHKDAIKALGTSHETTITIAHNLASTYASMGESSKAEKLFLETLHHATKMYGEKHPTTLKIKSQLAELQSKPTSAAQALAISQKLYEDTKTKLGEYHPDTLMQLNNLAAHYGELYNFETARELLEKALPPAIIALGKYHETILGMQKNLADIYLLLGKNEEREHIYKSLLASYKESKSAHNENYVTLLMDYADMLMQKNNIAEAIKIFEYTYHGQVKKFGKYSEQSYKPLSLMHDAVLSQLKILREYIKTPLPAPDQKALQQAHTKLEKTYKILSVERLCRHMLLHAKDDVNNAQFFALIGGSFAMLEEIPLGILFNKMALIASHKQRIRQVGLARELQQTYTHTQQYSYQLLMLLLAQQNRTREAFYVLNALKRDELDDVSFLNFDQENSEWAFFSKLEKAHYQVHLDMAEQFHTLGQEIRRLENRIETFTETEKKLLKLHYESVDVMKATYLHLLEEMQRQLTVSPKNLETQATEENIQELQNILKNEKDSLFIHTAATPQQFLIFVTGADAFEMHTVAISHESMKELIWQFRDAITNPHSDPRPTAQKLHDVIITPLIPTLKRLGAKKLVFSLDGDLRYIPMGALYDGKQWLVEKFSISTMSDAVRGKLVSPETIPLGIVAMGVTKALAGYGALPHVEAELQYIVKEQNAGIIDGKMLLDEQFTRHALLTHLKKAPPIVHVASHFHFDHTEQKKSFLLLGDGNTFTMGDMFSSQDKSLFQGVKLLTLSACDTASGIKMGDGREIESFGALAQRHGASAVLATLWPVADAATAVFMQEFYAQMDHKNKGKGEALAQTQRSFLQGNVTPSKAHKQLSQRGKVLTLSSSSQKQPETLGWMHPYFWAPFVLMGNWQ